MEKQVLSAAIQSREAYNKIARLVRPDEFTEVTRELWRLIDEFYTIDPDAVSVNTDLLFEVIERELPRQSDLLIAEIRGLSNTSPPNLVAEVIKVKRKHAANDIIEELARNPNSDKVLDLMDHYTDIADIEEEDNTAPANESAASMLKDLANPENLIKLYPAVLNEAIDGGVIPGNHILIFARPNIGKTMTVINLARGMCRDGHRVLHLINEEPKKQVVQRYVSRFSGLEKQEVYLDIDRAVDMANDNGFGNLYVEDINPGTFHEIRGLIEKIEPEVVIIDQLRNVRVGDQENSARTMERLATEARNLCKRYGIVVVSITQAGDSATNKLVLSDSDIDSSKTGIPAQCDLILGVGADDAQKQGHMRTITIVKNKLTPLHTYYPVRVNENLSKIVS